MEIVTNYPRGVAVAAACARCAAQAGGTEYAPGRHMAVICPHYRALCQDG